jgi:hypothetical protein
MVLNRKEKELNTMTLREIFFILKDISIPLDGILRYRSNLYFDCYTISININKRFDNIFIDSAKTIATQITLLIELYQAIAEKAQTHGQSVSSEIVSFLKILIF